MRIDTGIDQKAEKLPKKPIQIKNPHVGHGFFERSRT